jgi:hypothetical protein
MEPHGVARERADVRQMRQEHGRRPEAYPSFAATSTAASAALVRVNRENAIDVGYDHLST